MRFRSSAVAASLLALAMPAAAQHVEAGGGILVPLAQPSQTYTSSFEPPFPHVTHSGTAAQGFTIDPGTRAGVWGSLTWLSRRRLGVEFRGEFARVPLGGAGTQYTIAMSYVSHQPPDYAPREFRIDRTMQWPAPQGSVDRLSFSGSVVGVIGDPRRLSLRLSGGIGVTSIAGRFEPLALTAFQLGGHAVVFWNEYELQASIDRAWAVGLDGGAEVAHGIGDRVALVAGVHVVAARAVDAPVKVTSVAGDIAFQSYAPDAAQSAVSPPPFHWRTSALTMSAGLRVRL